jgi:hypothetical protein
VAGPSHVGDASSGRTGLSRSADDDPAMKLAELFDGMNLGHEPINLERPAQVRFGVDNGLMSDMALCPKSAKY